jgi:hypothetical protein
LQRINEERERQEQQENKESPVEEREMETEENINNSPKQDPNDKFTWISPEIKEKNKAKRKQKVSVKKKKAVVIHKPKKKLKNEEIFCTSSHEYENLFSDEQEVEEINRDYNLEEKSDICLRNEIIEWTQELESYRF